MQKFKKFVYYNENMNANSSFKRNFLKNYNDSEVDVKTKNAPFFMNFPNISFLYGVFSGWTGKTFGFCWESNLQAINISLES